MMYCTFENTYLEILQDNIYIRVSGFNDFGERGIYDGF